MKPRIVFPKPDHSVRVNLTSFDFQKSTQLSNVKCDIDHIVNYSTRFTCANGAYHRSALIHVILYTYVINENLFSFNWVLYLHGAGLGSGSLDIPYSCISEETSRVHFFDILLDKMRV